MSRRFVLIDDDGVSNKISEILLRKAFPEIEITSFRHPKEGLFYLESLQKAGLGHQETIVLLDLNMPEMYGLSLLDELINRDITTMEGVKIFVLSSTANPDEIRR